MTDLRPSEKTWSRIARGIARHHRLSFIVVLLAITSMACSGSCQRTPQSDAPSVQQQPSPEEPNRVIIRPAGIEDVDIQVLESVPVQVKVVVSGYLSDGCTTLDQILQKREGDQFRITITTKRPAGMNCPQVIVPFQEIIPLEVLGLEAGIYTVTVNDRTTKTFTLQADNAPE